MIRLLLGLIRPAEGRAYLQAADGRQVEVNAGLRRYFSYVPQGNTLLSGTIADNLRMVKPDASDAQLRAALEAACAWDFVSAMDGGLDASVGEHGHGLSEGQAQRIAIAQCLRDAPVLLLDEATSALDVATERTILRNLAARYPHKTCIVTTHRPTVDLPVLPGVPGVLRLPPPAGLRRGPAPGHGLLTLSPEPAGFRGIFALFSFVRLRKNREFVTVSLIIAWPSCARRFRMLKFFKMFFTVV